MIARISLLRKQPDISRSQFLKHWLGPHVDIARQVAGLRGLVTYSPIDMPLANCDGVGIMWFDSIEAAKTGLAHGPILQQLKEDRPKFLADVQFFLAQEHIVIPPHKMANEL
jgi:uncharacterized protein (TIGR02118 family)